MQQEREAKAKSKEYHECPDARFTDILSIHNVQEFGDYTFTEARALAFDNPYLFRMLADAAAIVRTSEPIAMKYAELQAEIERKHKKALK